MELKTRHQQFIELFPKEPEYRWQQIERAFFKHSAWTEVTTISKPMRGQLAEVMPWESFSSSKILFNRDKTTAKATLTLLDGLAIETVLLSNSKSEWTICVSSQVGCAMGCNFCLTGTMGLKRNLNSDEIIDQYRFWQTTLKNNHLTGRISNIVMMGMGEPLLNYDSVRRAFQRLLKNTDIGLTHITVSTIGIMAGLRMMLTDPDWPNVRIAISLHSADPETRHKLIPTSAPNFLTELVAWAKLYEKKLGNRAHHLTFEYIMIDGINDTLREASKLAHLVNSLERVKVNLIPYNIAKNKEWRGSPNTTIAEFAGYLKKHGVNVTCRRSLGDDLQAACGQLVVGDGG